ncbi:Alpha/Beta hydrolase protein [Fomitopsis serialis]|uniref:Alpha/Beta hydrolase protein n=1 Tax=Fomitopsis serialis TaxID=139415 RepID=UPI00200795C1|nr:Alpha/Beta hydrolase protein [Neoantrodia serialis]KAH9920474.1 Alpha/Beta hydrolase protein [Neoantrodia serialis]
MATSEPQPFTISVPDADLALLHEKLDLTRFPDELDDAAWNYGVPLANVKRLIARWKDGYDWRAAEAGINEIPQFTRDVEVEGFGTLNVHYVHKKSEVKDAIPLVFVHGWPGHFLEVKKLLPLLTSASPDHPNFHVVAPSLPNFGFSEIVKKQGFTVAQYAETCHKLMLALGYSEYVVQGGDWGSYITRTMAAMYGDQIVKAWHTNYAAVVSPPSFSSFPRLWLQHLLTPYTEVERACLKRIQLFMQKGRGYSAEQNTQPQTIGYSLADSPAGLLAWIYEKLVLWSDGYPWDDDEVLTWISIYWFSRAGPAASARIYYEQAKVREDPNHSVPWCAAPGGVSFFPKELIRPPKTYSEHGNGGHFAAHEKPDELGADLRAMFGKGGPAFGVVAGKAGYD